MSFGEEIQQNAELRCFLVLFLVFLSPKPSILPLHNSNFIISLVVFVPNKQHPNGGGARYNKRTSEALTKLGGAENKPLTSKMEARNQVSAQSEVIERSV